MNGKDEILGEYLNLNLKKLDTPQFYTKKTQNDPKKDNNAIISQDFKILSVSATNLREIEVEFSQPV